MKNERHFQWNSNVGQLPVRHLPQTVLFHLPRHVTRCTSEIGLGRVLHLSIWPLTYFFLFSLLLDCKNSRMPVLFINNFKILFAAIELTWSPFLFSYYWSYFTCVRRCDSEWQPEKIIIAKVNQALHRVREGGGCTVQRDFLSCHPFNQD